MPKTSPTPADTPTESRMDVKRHDGRPAGVERHGLGDGHSHDDADETAHRRDGKGLDDELIPDIHTASTYGPPDADLARPLENRGQHDVHDADTAHEQ